jgi:hypothetical protein
MTEASDGKGVRLCTVSHRASIYEEFTVCKPDLHCTKQNMNIALGGRNKYSKYSQEVEKAIQLR